MCLFSALRGNGNGSHRQSKTAIHRRESVNGAARPEAPAYGFKSKMGDSYTELQEEPPIYGPSPEEVAETMRKGSIRLSI